MQIDPISRSVRLSVREFATFRNLPASERVGGYSGWRAAVGQKWHKVSEAQTREQTSDARFEVTIVAEVRHRDWIFKLQGRIDQVVPQSDALCLREVKTVRAPLPMDMDELYDRYPEHFAQIATYRALAELLPDYADLTLSAELLFIDIENGAVQSVPLDDATKSLFTQQLDALIPFLDDRRACRLRLNETKITPAFENLRDGQADLIATLDKAALQAKTVILEAPTGFGKTGIILEHALTQMKNGLYERCIYLTSKSTGQLETIRQLSHMTSGQVRYIQMRNRKEHRIKTSMHTCTGDNQCNNSLGQYWIQAGIHPPELFEDGTFEIDQAQSIGGKTGVCPYALTKGCLPFAEIWIGDSNYIFAPSSQSVFMEQQGFDAAKTLLIIDEAHNLPDRAADALSVEINSGDLIFALEEMSAAGAGRRLISIGNELVRCIDAQAPKQPLNANVFYELLDLCEDFTKQLKSAQFDYDQCAPFAIELAWRIPDLVHRFSEPSHQWLHWMSKSGTVRAHCLDASQWIARCMEPFGGSLLMSATLSPVDAFRDCCGLTKENTTLAIGHAPWRTAAYDVAIDCRVDTRYNQREKYYELTARTIASLIASSPTVPVAVFFASYLYAENIRSYLEAIVPHARIQLQPRGVDLNEQEQFIDEGLLIADALFLILGSSYAEGVDKLGGHIQTVMVVGPALPEVNAVQQAKMDAHPSLSRDEEFRDVYILPAMQRIHQALGRIVRAPGHKARVLLHGKRYAELAYKSALADEYQDAIELRSDEAFGNWICET
ncbi:MAG: helicase C-terminal domain-containing protein [Lentimonas sp.]